MLESDENVLFQMYFYVANCLDRLMLNYRGRIIHFHTFITDLMKVLDICYSESEQKSHYPFNACCISIPLHFFHLPSLINLNLQIPLGRQRRDLQRMENITEPLKHVVYCSYLYTCNLRLPNILKLSNTALLISVRV